MYHVTMGKVKKPIWPEVVAGANPILLAPMEWLLFCASITFWNASFAYFSIAKNFRQRVDENILQGLLDSVVSTLMIGVVKETAGWNSVRRYSFGKVGFPWNDEETLDRQVAISLGLKIMRNQYSIAWISGGPLSWLANCDCNRIACTNPNS